MAPSDGRSRVPKLSEGAREERHISILKSVDMGNVSGRIRLANPNASTESSIEKKGIYMKYKIGDICRIKTTGEKVTILCPVEDGSYEVDRGIMRGVWNCKESELKPFCPSRMNGKIRDEKGRLRSKQKYDFSKSEDIKRYWKSCGVSIDGSGTPNPTPEKIEKECGCSEYSLCGKHAKEHMFDPTLVIGGYHKEIKKLIDAHYALEERIDKLEKRHKDDVGLLSHAINRLEAI